ncbi:cell division protein FtsL [bacterium endosymbiont of Pedicinus badii]|uniref:cell division protein FtsL n=1 Tax=bacterium endosymbiont of Pedicinus badii TaxID=1719126 RepID=UPI0009BC516F|nr:cell division protein FtsL [bacterium endosymbiont of Pedicinus badii]OQM34212.1 hypothetical protein AOQ89_02670 [bacterium endosymbiont of Pedicinus badii]
MQKKYYKLQEKKKIIKYGLVRIILYDISKKYKSSIVLLLLNAASAFFVVYFTYQTRILNIKKENLEHQISLIDIKNDKLTLEKNTIGNFKRIEFLAKQKFGMCYPLEKNLIKEKSNF